MEQVKLRDVKKQKKKEKKNHRGFLVQTLHLVLIILILSE